MAQKPCYTPNGSNRNAMYNVPDGAIYQACNNEVGVVSMCCATGLSRTSTKDACLPSGLCSNSDNAEIWRESCTDPTWQDPACIKLFVNGTGINSTMGTSYDANGNVLNDASLTNCSDVAGSTFFGSFCLGNKNNACCTEGQGVYILNGEQVSFDPNATATAITTTPSTSPSNSTPISSSTPSASSSSSNSGGGLSTGATAGIAVGATLGAILVLGLAIFIWIKHLRKKKRRIQPSELGAYPAPSMLETPSAKHELSGSTPLMNSKAPLSELDGSNSGSGTAEDFVRKPDAPGGRYP